MFVEREAFRQQGLTAEVQLMDETVYRGLLQRDKVDKFWASVLDIILEKMSRTVLKHRSTLPDDEVQAYVVTREATLELENLSEETRMRIPNLGELMELKQRMQVDRLRGPELRTEYQQKSQKAIWDARTWLYQKQLIDDFVFFTMLNNLCIDNKVQMYFNLRKAFKKFAQEANRPSDAAIPVEEAREEGLTGRDQPLGIEEQLNIIRIEK